MKIVLISAPSRTNMPAFTLPFNVMYLASYLIENTPHEVTIIDAAKLRPSPSELAQMVKRENPNLIGIGGIITTFKYIREATREMRNQLKGVPIVIGGQVASPIPEIIFKSMECDYVVHGYGEVTLSALATALENHEPIESIGGISFLKNSELTKTGKPTFVNTLDDLPFPAYELIDMQYYIDRLGKDFKDLSRKYLLKTGKDIKNYRTTQLLASRGCVAKCTFCIHETEYSGYWPHSLGYIVKHIECLKQKYDIGCYLIGEEMVFPTLKGVSQFIDIMNTKYPDAFYLMSARANMLTKEYVRELERGNCARTSFGFETGSPKMLEVYYKKVTRKQNIDAYVNLTNSKLSSFKATFMLGGPGEDYQTMKETIDAIKEGEMVSSNIGIFMTTPYPGSRLYNWCLKKGLIKNEEQYLLEISGRNADVLSVNMTPFPDIILKLMRRVIYAAAESNEEKKKTIKFSFKHKITRWLLPYMAVEAYFFLRKILGLVFVKYRHNDLSYEIDDKGLLKV
jgi:radical SAM superfamily enzyme YgiQ (UPF0313 family)